MNLGVQLLRQGEGRGKGKGERERKRKVNPFRTKILATDLMWAHQLYAVITLGTWGGICNMF